MKLKDEKKLLADLAVIKDTVNKMYTSFWSDHDDLQSLKTVKKDLNTKINDHISTTRWVFGIMFLIVVGALWRAII